MDEGTEQQPRISGVRYTKVTRYRPETTVIDGHPETRDVPYDEWLPVPPRDWDQIILRAVTAVAVVVTLLAVSGTTASIGGLLVTLVPAFIAYSIAVIFDVSWLACIAVEWLERFDPKRARAARICGWTALAISMSAVIAFGHHHHETVAGVAGGAVTLLAKGLWWLVLRYYAVPLSDGVSFWLRRRRERIAATMAISGQLRRLNAYEAYAQAAYGTDAARAQEITAAHTDAVPSAQVLNNGGDMVNMHPVQASPNRSGDGPKKDQVEQTPPVTPITGGSIAATIREMLAVKADITDDDLTARVVAVHGDRKGLAETVRRTRSRIKKQEAS